MSYFNVTNMSAQSLAKMDFDTFCQHLHYNHLDIGDVTPSYLNERIALLEVVKENFKKYSSFNDMPLTVKKLIAGTNDTHFNLEFNQNIDGKIFGIMSAAGKFANRINNEDEHIGNALDKIPLTGEITEDQYNQYINEFRIAFDNYNSMGVGIAVTTRLLAMKRPDFFICLNSANDEAKRQIFNRRGINTINYWETVINPLHNMNWYKSQPSNQSNIFIWDTRAAILDTLMYAERN